MSKDEAIGNTPIAEKDLSKDEIIEMALLKNISGGGCSKVETVNTCGTRAGNPEGDNSCWNDTCYKQITVDIP